MSKAKSVTPSVQPVAYDENAIKTLSSLEHIRLRPGMYIGRLGNGSHRDDGIYLSKKSLIMPSTSTSWGTVTKLKSP